MTFISYFLYFYFSQSAPETRAMLLSFAMVIEWGISSAKKEREQVDVVSILNNIHPDNAWALSVSPIFFSFFSIIPLMKQQQQQHQEETQETSKARESKNYI